MKHTGISMQVSKVLLSGIFSLFLAGNLAAQTAKQSASRAGSTVELVRLDRFSEEEQALLKNSLWARFADAGDLKPRALSAEEIRLTDIANTLGGFGASDGSPLKKVIEAAEWKQHEQRFGEIWKNVDELQLIRARKWAESEVDPLRGTNGGLFYPFSGPDFLYGNTFFPNAHTYVLAGLEPVGEVPDLSKMTNQELSASFRSLQKSLDDILRLSFFKTNDMRVDFRHNQLKGVIPIILTFMAKKEMEILAVDYVGLDYQGILVDVAKDDREKAWENLIPGVKITFRKKGESKRRKLVYFSVNLHDAPMADQPEIRKFVRMMRLPACYLKSASYLMHKDYFSKIRNIILEECNLVLEDPSGIPVRFFTEDKFERHFYGNYTGAISLFSNYYQADLMKIYNQNPDIQRLDFGIGYKYKVNTSAFMLMLNRNASKWFEENAPKGGTAVQETTALPEEKPEEPATNPADAPKTTPSEEKGGVKHKWPSKDAVKEIDGGKKAEPTGKDAVKKSESSDSANEGKDAVKQPKTGKDALKKGGQETSSAQQQPALKREVLSPVTPSPEKNIASSTPAPSKAQINEATKVEEEPKSYSLEGLNIVRRKRISSTKVPK